jgi:hypothetical protein
VRENVAGDVCCGCGSAVKRRVNDGDARQRATQSAEEPPNQARFAGSARGSPRRSADARGDGAYFRPSFFPAERSSIDSRIRRSRVSGRLAVSIHTTKCRRYVGASA